MTLAALLALLGISAWIAASPVRVAVAGAGLGIGHQVPAAPYAALVAVLIVAAAAPFVWRTCRECDWRLLIYTYRTN